MKMWLCIRKFTTVGEVLTKPLTASQVDGGHCGRGDGTWGQSKDKDIITACRLLRIEDRMLLCIRKFTTVGEILTKPLTASRVGGGHWGGGEGTWGQSKDKDITTACRLLRIEDRMWLCNRKFTTVGEVLTKPLIASQVGGGHWGRGEGTWGQSKDKDITTACKLLEIEESQMKIWLCNSKSTTMGEVLAKPHTASQVDGGHWGRGEGTWGQSRERT